MNWTLLVTSGLIESKVRPWLKVKSEEYLGTVEETFVNSIMKKLANMESA